MTDHEKLDHSVLIVDDDAEMCELLSSQFELVGFTVLTAGNGSEALKILAQTPVDVVVSDVRMPVMTGLELLDSLQGWSERPVVFLMSGFSDVTEAEAIARGAEGLVSKPLKSKELIGVVRTCLARRPKRSA